MTVRSIPPSCPRCASPTSQPGQHCSACAGSTPGSALTRPPVALVSSPKSAGVAVVLSLLWFGAGHLYANRVATGVVLMIVDLIIVCIAFTGVGLFVSVPAWIVMAPIVAVLSASATTAFNRHHSVVLR